MIKTFKLGLPFLATLCFLLLLSACVSDTSNGNKFRETAFEGRLPDDPGNNSNPLVLRLVVNDTYCSATACACVHYLASREYDDVLQILKKDYNIELELIYCIEEYYLEDSIRTAKYDGAICKPWFAFQFMHETGMDLKRIVDVLDPFENGLLGGAFIVDKNSPIEKPEDIKGNVLVVGEENSYEKYHAALHLLDESNIQAEEIIHVSACSEGINALLDKKAEVAVVSDYALVASCAVDLAEEDAFRTIWQTKDIPLCSLILDLNKVGKKDAARLQAALLEISEKKLPKSFASNGFIKPIPWTPKPYVKSDTE